MSAHRLSGEPPGKGEFCVPSESMQGECWYVTWISEALHWCGCARYRYRGACRHVEAVALAVEVEARERPTPERRAEAARRLEQIEQEMSL